MAAVLTSIALPRDANACTPNSPVVEEGCPITTNNYTIDLARGPVIGSNRAVSMGGAHTAMVEGPDGVLWNPAAYAAHSRSDPSSWRFDFFASVAFIYNDYLNTGRLPSPGMPPPFQNYYVGLVGLNFQYGRFGIGDMLEFHTFVINDGSRALLVDLIQNHIGLGYMFLGGQLTVGVGLRVSYMNMQIPAPLAVLEPLVSYVAYAGEIGAVWKPETQRFRVGLAARAGVPATTQPVLPTGTPSLMRGGSCASTSSSGCFVLPNAINTPWQVDIGFAWQFGPRIFSPRWEDASLDMVDFDQSMEAARRMRRNELDALLPRLSPSAAESAEAAWRRREDVIQAEENRRRWLFLLEGDRVRRARFDARDRRYVVVAADLQIVGPTLGSGQGIDAFLAQTGHASGQSVTFSPRLGAESEPILNQLKLRIGTYLEPSRYAGVEPRVHGTLGTDIRLFSTTLLSLIPRQYVRLSAYIDYTFNYFDWGLTLGFWE